jgi:hypothetical protein
LKKFPSLIRLPSHKRFNYEPRHYDPIKEEIENRIATIKREMGQSDDEGEYKSGISGAFRRNQESKATISSGFLQLIIFTVLFGGFVGWIFYGNLVLYILSAFIPVYLFLRLRRKI